MVNHPDIGGQQTVEEGSSDRFSYPKLKQQKKEGIEKLEKYQELNEEVKKIWRAKANIADRGYLSSQSRDPQTGRVASTVPRNIIGLCQAEHSLRESKDNA